MILGLRVCSNVSWKSSGNLLQICLVGFVDTLMQSAPNEEVQATGKQFSVDFQLGM